MSSGPIELRDNSGLVRFEGQASPAPGGGSIAKQATYNGDAAGLGAHADGPFSWLKSSPDDPDLLDLTDPATPTVIEAGVYAVSCVVFGFDDTADGFIEGALNIGALITSVTNAPYASGGGSVGVSATAVLAAGDPIILNYLNGGTSTVELAMTAGVVKIA